MDVFEDIDDSVDYFQNLFLETAQLHIPYKTVIIRPKDKPWFVGHLEEEIALTLDGRKIPHHKIIIHITT